MAEIIRMSETGETSAEETTANEEGGDNKNIIKPKKPYVFEGKEYREIDLNGLEKLTIQDAIDVQQRLFGQEEIATTMITETTTAFARAIAAKATDLPVEFFKYMPRGLGKKVTTKVQQSLNVDIATENHVMKLSKPYLFKDKEYTEIDLNGLADMTCMNESEAENRMVRAGVMITDNSRNYLYSCIMASMATGLPENFFTGLPFSETLKLRTAVNDSDFFE